MQKLKDSVKELMDWKLQNSIQQIPFNPPVNTTKIMQDGMLVATGNTEDGLSTVYDIMLNGAVFSLCSSAVYDIMLEVSLDGEKVFIPATLK